MVIGVYTDVRKSGRATLGEVLLNFDSQKRAHLPASDPERSRIRKFCEHAISRIRLSSLTPKHFADYRDERLKLVKGTTVTRELVDFTRFRRHISTSSSKLFECQRTQLVEVTVPTDSIVETLDAIKYI